MVGQTLGAYRIVSELGRGGMGAVYLGVHELLGRRAAIKVLLPEMSADRTIVERFFNEAKATSAISDPGIVQVFDFGFTADKTAYIVMELLEGQSLRERLRRRGRLPPRDAVLFVRQIASSLAATHATGIIHRDLKPENLFVVRDSTMPTGERVKILDFGIAKLDGDTAPDRFKTRTGAVFGTPVYMSPEQCKSSSNVDLRADIYSLGCVLFHLLTNRPPFDAAGLGAIMLAHMSDPVPVPSVLVPEIPTAIDSIVIRCMAKARDDRYATMIELVTACDEILAHPATDSRGSVPPVTAATMPPGQALAWRRYAIWGGAAALAIAAGIALSFMVAGKSSQAAPSHTSATAAAAPVVVPAAVQPPPPQLPVEQASSPPPDAAEAMTPVPEPAAVAVPQPPAPPPSDTASSKHGSGAGHPHGRPPKSAPATNGGSEDLYGDR